MSHLQLLGGKLQQDGKKARAAVLGVTALLEALEGVMRSEQYLSALLLLLQTSSPALVPRIMRLYEACLAKDITDSAVPTALQLCNKVSILHLRSDLACCVIGQALNCPDCTLL